MSREMDGKPREDPVDRARREMDAARAVVNQTIEGAGFKLNPPAEYGLRQPGMQENFDFIRGQYKKVEALHSGYSVGDGPPILEAWREAKWRWQKEVSSPKFLGYSCEVKRDKDGQ